MRFLATIALGITLAIAFMAPPAAQANVQPVQKARVELQNSFVQPRATDTLFKRLVILGMVVVTGGILVSMFRQARNAPPMLTEYLELPNARDARGRPQCRTCSSSHFHLGSHFNTKVHICRMCGTNCYRTPA